MGFRDWKKLSPEVQEKATRVIKWMLETGSNRIEASQHFGLSTRTIGFYISKCGDWDPKLYDNIKEHLHNIKVQNLELGR